MVAAAMVAHAACVFGIWVSQTAAAPAGGSAAAVAAVAAVAAAAAAAAVVAAAGGSEDAVQLRRADPVWKCFWSASAWVFENHLWVLMPWVLAPWMLMIGASLPPRGPVR